MAKPSTPFSWATDPTFTSGPKTGSTSKLAPSAAQRGQGDIPGQSYIAEWHNYALNEIGKWTEYLNGLHDETAFTAADFVWLGNHTFNFGLTAAGIVSSDVFAYRFPSTLTEVPVKLALGQPGRSDWAFNASGMWFNDSAAGPLDQSLMLPLLLPNGCTLNNYRVHLYSGPGCTAEVDLIRIERNYATGAATVAVLEASGVITLAAGASTYTVPTLAPELIAGTSAEYFLRVTRKTGQVDVRAAFVDVEITYVSEI